MHLQRIVGPGFVLLLGLIVGVFGSVEIARAQSNVQRGECLVNIMAGNDCHTPVGPGGQPIMAYKLAGHPPDAPVTSPQNGRLGALPSPIPLGPVPGG
jgi:hypothetical protein